MVLAWVLLAWVLLDGGRGPAGPAGTPGSGGARVTTTAGAPARADQTGRVDFNRDIRPILTENCYACHGPDLHAVEADLSLHTFEQATRELYPGTRAIVPGDPEASEAWARINDRRTPMPPKDSHKKLTDQEKDLIRRWIEQGGEYMPHWAYVPPRQTPAPQVRDTDWPTHWIDRYILARLESEGLSPVGDADRVTLVRRLSFDLTGLPPTPEQVDAYVNDASDNAYEKLVDRLLASPHYGERMAMYWLDLVRFADTVGYHSDQTHNISPYRDWVIWAFNRNMPYDRFVTHQLAGDLIEGADDDSLLASAYNRLLQTSHEGGVQLKEYTAIYDADRVRNVSEAFMGATIGCAQCHDHKYDPYTARDFYALAAFFADIDDIEHLRDPYAGLNRLPTPRAPELDLLSPLDRQRQAELEARLAAAGDDAERQAIQREIESIQPRRVMISKVGQTPREVRYLHRGDWMDQTGDVMQPAIPAFMGELGTDGRATRLDLARWMTRPIREGGSGELTARVLVNRLWYLMYGEGLCTTLGDFGGQGMPPNHPELLDRLALELIGSGWDIKAMMKTLAMTRVYRLSSEPAPGLLEADPDNELFARQSQHRLQAEMIRDNALMISGLLVHQLGGASVRPYQPAGYYHHLNHPRRQYEPDTDADQWRRGLYVHWQRTFLHPMLKVFDGPTREECTAKRPISNTPLAALTLMNDPTFVEASRAFAQRALTEAGGGDRARLDWAMRQAVLRPPTDAELAILLPLLDENRRQFTAEPQRAHRLLSVGLSPRDETLDAAEHAAWTEVCRTILNLHETITRP